MADLWYPGRIPLCTPKVIRGLKQYIEALQHAIERQDTTFVQVAGRIHQAIHATLYEEGLDCLGSDTDINNMLNLFIQAQQAAELCAQRDCWDDLDEVVNALDVVRWSLIEKQEGGGTDDGDEPGATPTPDPHEPTGHGTDGPTPAGEEDWLVDATGSQQEIEDALLRSYEEDQEEGLEDEDDSDDIRYGLY